MYTSYNINDYVFTLSNTSEAHLKEQDVYRWMFILLTEEEGKLGEGEGEILSYIVKPKDYHLRGGRHGPDTQPRLTIPTYTLMS